MNKEYDDIINLPRHVSKTRGKMPIIDRAAQFAPFAALTGHDAAIKETARLTEERVELDEYMKADLNSKLQIIGDRLKEKPELSITYFIPDEIKEGGSYITVRARAKKLDEYEGLLIMSNDTEIPIEEIIKIEGNIFA